MDSNKIHPCKLSDFLGTPVETEQQHRGFTIRDSGKQTEQAESGFTNGKMGIIFKLKLTLCTCGVVVCVVHRKYG